MKKSILRKKVYRACNLLEKEKEIFSCYALCGKEIWQNYLHNKTIRNYEKFYGKGMGHWGGRLTDSLDPNPYRDKNRRIIMLLLFLEVGFEGIGL